MNSVLTLSEPKQITAEEFAERYAGDRVELIDGIVTELPMPFFNHGKICLLIGSALLNWILEHDLGQVASNDSFVRTGTDPDRVRGPDICYYSFARLPRGPIPQGVMTVPPDLVVEVRSPSDSPSEIFAKVTEYLNAGVIVVMVIDPASEAVSNYRLHQAQEDFSRGQLVTISDLLPGFSVPVDRLFS